jgi:hypothetical protein
VAGVVVVLASGRVLRSGSGLGISSSGANAGGICEAGLDEL